MHAIVADGVDHLVHESLGRDVGQLQIAIVLQHVLPDRVHQVGLAETDAAVDEQRVVGARRRFGDGAAGGVRELIRRSDDEGVEGVAGIEPGGPGLRRSGGGPVSSAAASSALSGIDGRVGCASETKLTEQVRPLQLGHRFGDDARVVLGQPVLEQRVRDPDGDRARGRRRRTSSA